MKRELRDKPLGPLASMQQLKLSIIDKEFNLTLVVKHVDLIDCICGALKGYVISGRTIKTTLTYIKFPERITRTIAMTISDAKQLIGWGEEIKELLASLRSGKAQSANNCIQLVIGEAKL